MTLIFRSHSDRGLTQTDWLTSHHTFSFDRYVAPNPSHFGPLKVLNEDLIAPGQGFPLHRHQAMEIVTYVIAGQLEHRDSLGHIETLSAGHFQVMNAGSGMAHSEFNRSVRTPLHIVQVWIAPAPTSSVPRPQYASLRTSLLDQLAGWRLMARMGGGPDTLSMSQDINIWAAFVHAGTPARLTLRPDRMAWVHTISGRLTATIPAQTIALKSGDGLGLIDETEIILTTSNSGQILVFDMQAVPESVFG